MLQQFATVGFALLALAALAFYLVGYLGLASWRWQRRPGAFTPPVSILKPLKGCDPAMFAAFRSHCLQDYPAGYEIIFGVNSADDEAVPYVRQLQVEFPHVDMTLLVCEQVFGANRKVSNLVQMLDRSRCRYVIINDSDICVPPEYLREVLAWFSDPAVGMVTCLYRARAGMSIWAKLESLGVLADFMPGALAARFLERRVRFGLGATMAIDRTALDAIGGLRPLCDFLADDYEIGSRICDQGRRVVVSGTVVETSTPEYRWKEFWDHQLRWGRTVRSSRPGGYLGLIVTFGFLWSLLAVLLSRGSWWSLLLFGSVIAARVSTALLYGAALRDRSARFVAMLPLRDLLSPVIWLWSLVGNRIVWRGEEFELQEGKLRRSAPSSSTDHP